jgi:hypothetical protein
MPNNILKFQGLCYAVIQLCFRAQNETAGNSHFSEIATSKDVIWLLPNTPLYRTTTRFTSGSCRTVESLSGYTSKMMTDRASTSLISAFRRLFVSNGSVFQGQWDSPSEI